MYFDFVIVIEGRQYQVLHSLTTGYFLTVNYFRIFAVRFTEDI